MLALTLIVFFLGILFKASAIVIVSAIIAIIAALQVQIDGGLSTTYSACVATNSTYATCVNNTVLIPSTQIVALILAIFAMICLVISFRMARGE